VTTLVELATLLIGAASKLPEFVTDHQPVGSVANSKKES